MRKQPGRRHSIFCILPPHVLREIARTGVNSGIPNKAFYLAATGMGGYAGAKAR